MYDYGLTERILPSFIIIATTIKEKMNALATIAISGISMIEIPKTMAKAAPNAAPEATPNVRGDTRGLPRHPCIKEPATAKAAPAIIAIKILGNLNFQIMFDCSSDALSIPSIILRVEIISRFSDEPKPIETIDNTIVESDKIAT